MKRSGSSLGSQHCWALWDTKMSRLCEDGHRTATFHDLQSKDIEKKPLAPALTVNPFF